MPMTSTKLHARRHRKTCSCTFSTHHIFGTVQDKMKQMLLQLLEKRWGCNFYVAVKHSLQLQLQSFTLKQLFSEESCSVVGLSEKMSFQLRSELSATVEQRSGGSAFQTIGAAMEKLSWPMDAFARKTNRSPRPAERSDRRDDSETGQMACLR